MRFQYKLTFVALAILVFTLLLSSLLSLASFEKIYSASLISTYEVSGKNLQRKIQSALRFGKPLPGFVAMHDLLAEVQSGDPDIVRIDVTAPDQTLLYSTGLEPRGAASPYTEQYPDFSAEDTPAVTTRLIKGRYVTFLPLHDRQDQLAGALNLEFPREAVYRQLRSMAWDNLRTLGVIMFGAVVILALLVHYRISIPIQSKLTAIVKNIGARRTDPAPVKTGPDKDGQQGDEFDELHDAVAEIARESAQKLAQRERVIETQQALGRELQRLDQAMAAALEADPAALSDLAARHAELKCRLEALVNTPAGDAAPEGRS